MMRVPVVAGQVAVSSPFGLRSGGFHYGVDLVPVPRGGKPDIFALHNGIVVLAQHSHRTCGNWVEIWDGGMCATYMHLDSIAPEIFEGATVKQGDRIGVMGSTGDSTGVHLHFELRYQRQRGGFVDPLPYLTEGSDFMDLRQRPSPNHSPREGQQPVMIVVHTTGGNFTSAINTITNPASQVSYHFVISREAEVVQTVDIAQMAWANGTNNTEGHAMSNATSTLAIVRQRRVNANLYTISIGLADMVNSRPTAAQLQALAQLIGKIRREVQQRFGADIPLTREHIVGHDQIVPRHRPDCPGRSFPWHELMEAIGGASPAPEASPTVPEGSARLPQSGDNLHRAFVGPFVTRAEADAERGRIVSAGHAGAFIRGEDGRFWVQVAAVGVRDNAKGLVDALAQQGFRAVVG